MNSLNAVVVERMHLSNHFHCPIYVTTLVWVSVHLSWTTVGVIDVHICQVHRHNLTLGRYTWDNCPVITTPFTSYHNTSILQYFVLPILPLRSLVVLLLSVLCCFLCHVVSYVADQLANQPDLSPPLHYHISPFHPPHVLLLSHTTLCVSPFSCTLEHLLFR